jgi:hypothetical protein
MLGQTPIKQNYIGVRAGYLLASTDLTTVTSIALPYQIRLGGVAPLNSFYAGAFYHHTLLPWLAYRVDLNYQRKGIENQLPNGDVVFRQKFHYVGLTPLIGITPIDGLGLFVGPEANVYFGQSIWSANAAPIELGISSRVSYRYRWIGLEVGYFKGLNEYTSLNLFGARFGFKNRTWQAGLLFVPAMLKKGSSSN